MDDNNKSLGWSAFDPSWHARWTPDTCWPRTDEFINNFDAYSNRDDYGVWSVHWPDHDLPDTDITNEGPLTYS